jgi:hypothetical protein
MEGPMTRSNEPDVLKRGAGRVVNLVGVQTETLTDEQRAALRSLYDHLRDAQGEADDYAAEGEPKNHVWRYMMTLFPLMLDVPCQDGLCAKDGLTFVCGTCHRFVPYCFGAADAHSEDCDDCAMLRRELAGRRFRINRETETDAESFITSNDGAAMGMGYWQALIGLDVGEAVRLDFGTSGTNLFTRTV